MKIQRCSHAKLEKNIEFKPFFSVIEQEYFWLETTLFDYDRNIE